MYENYTISELLSLLKETHEALLFGSAEKYGFTFDGLVNPYNTDESFLSRLETDIKMIEFEIRERVK